MKFFYSNSLYPFLFVLYLNLALLESNAEQVSPSLAVRPMVVLLLSAAAGLLLFHALFRDWQYAAYLVFLVFAFFFTFEHLNRLAQDRLSILDAAAGQLFFLIVWALLLILLCSKPVWSVLGGRSGMIPFLNIVCLLALIQPVFRLAVSALPAQSAPASASPAERPNTGELDCSSTPDIYLIILDAYGRADVLEALYGLDNLPFLEYLRAKGFYVAEESHTNYTQTVFSIPAVLNFSYIGPPTASQIDWQYFRERIRENELMRILKTCGYRIAALESGFYYTDVFDTDLQLTERDYLNEFEEMLLAGSPTSVLAEVFNLEPSEQSYAAHRQRVLAGFEMLKMVAQVPGPKLVFAHLITPHPPFVFEADGGYTQPDRGYSLADGDEYEGDLDEYRTGYASQVQFVNRRLEETIDALLANSETPPVIILQSDHGPGSRLDWSSPGKTCLWERTAILNAYYLPGSGSDQLYPSISPVNSFRVILNAVFGTDLPLLPDNTYFTSHLLERQVIDITEGRDSRALCE